jgi:hypothetical protein
MQISVLRKLGVVTLQILLGTVQLHLPTYTND